jgi:hypothetical protein
MLRVVIPETRETKALVVVTCAYEIAAITSGRIPTITALNIRWPVVGFVILGALAIHFWTPEPPLEET